MVTLTKEGGIGKTAMAGELADWCVERGVFPGGVYELACETYASAEAFLSRLLEVLGVPLAEQRGDLMALLRGWFSERFPAEQPSLLVLDNLDDLFAGASPARIEAGRLIEAALESAPSLRVLATCRWPLGLAEHERPIEVPPLRADEARDVFIENLVGPAHQSEVRATWGRPDSAAHDLIDKLSGRHPHALVLLARQMGRKGMTLVRLRDEARSDEHACEGSSAETGLWLLAMNEFLVLSGQRLLHSRIAERVVLVQRARRLDEDLAPCLATLGNALCALGERVAARAACDEALGLYRRLAAAHPAAYEPDVAMTLNNLGTVLGELGELEPARKAYEEALGLYWPLAQRLPQAFGQNFVNALRNYVRITEEAEDDPWWRMWRDFEAGAGEGGQET